ncbi:MAG: general secretion pathway protein L [Motiliproteus sp.]|jgi:general secretion pathway protein L
MSECLLLRLGTAAEQPVYWLHWDESQQQVLDQGQLDNLSQLSQLTVLAIRIPCYALVSQAAVLSTQVQLPNDSRAAREAIPYQLEEQLCEEIENLHFATGIAVAPGRYPVLVVAKTLMNFWLQGLAEAGIPIRALLADAQAIAYQAGQPRAIPLLDQILIRDSQGQSFAFPGAQAEQWLSRAEDPLGQCIEVAMKTSRGETHKQQGLAALAACFAPNNAIDLLQGRYQLKNPVNQLLRAWKLPAVLLGLILLLGVGQLLWQVQQLNQQQQQLEQQIADLFKTILPGSRRVNPKAQFDTELKQLTRRGQGSDFLQVLQGALPAFESNNAVKIRDMGYQAQTQTLILELEARDHGMLEGFAATLSQQHLSAQILRSQQRDGQVSAQLSIKGER